MFFLKFIVKSYSFKRIIVISAVFIVIVVILNILFDKIWGSTTSIPIITLEEIYSPPKEYDNIKKVNLKLISKDKIAIEGNKKLKIKDKQREFDYYDTLSFFQPENDFDRSNKLIFQFEGSNVYDSVNLVISKSEIPKIFYNQVFHTSVKVNSLNEFSEDPGLFRINPSNLVKSELLSNNDTLIQQALDYFNKNINDLELGSCGRNSQIFKSICDNFGVPCRIINLQGGDMDQDGFNDMIGYPLHVVCEVYSSRLQKWYVIDPSFGFRFQLKSFNDYLNAVEISNKHTFNREEEIGQDSILLTKRSLVGKDYFKYYENVAFTRKEWKNPYLRKLVYIFYNKFNYFLLLFSNNFPIKKNAFYYFGLKTFLYFFILILYINTMMILILRRLFQVKNPKNKY